MGLFKKKETERTRIKKTFAIVPCKDHKKILFSTENDNEFLRKLAEHFFIITQQDNFEVADKDGFHALIFNTYSDGQVTNDYFFRALLVKKSLVKGFVKDKKMFKFAVEFGFPALVDGNWDGWVREEDKAKIQEIIDSDHKALVVKGTDYPYWFKINGKLIASKTSSWQNYLYTEHNYVSEATVEEYNGPDKYQEHKR